MKIANLPKEKSQYNAQFIREHIGWPRRKLAEELGISEGTVEYWVHKIRAEKNGYMAEKFSAEKSYRSQWKRNKDKELADRVSKIAEMQRDANRKVIFGIDDLENEIRRTGFNGTDSVKNSLILRSSLLTGDNIQRLSCVIDEIVDAYQNIKEELLRV